MNFLEYNNVTSDNRDIILDEIKEFLPYYLFNDEISDSFDTNVKDLFELSDSDIFTLKVVHFFLNKDMEFFINSLPKLLKNLSHTTNSNKILLKDNIRGRIDWNSTFKTRFSNGFNDNNLFVCTTSSKIYDLEENQLLKFILKKIISFFNRIKFARLKSIDYGYLDSTDQWYNSVNKIFRNCEKTINKVYFDEISDINHVLNKHKIKCIKNRNQLYFQVFKIYKLYEDLFINNDKEVLNDLVNTRIIRVTNPDKVYELYIFFKLVNIIPNWKIKLMHENNKYFVNASLENNVEITIFYQRTPDKLKKSSKYLKILENYKYILGNVRSPDIIIEFEKDGHYYYRIIEVKNVSESTYLHDGLYKVMGYYHDFDDDSSCNLMEKYPIVLVGWCGALVNNNYDIFEKDKYIILDYGTFNENIKKLIKFK